MSETMLDVVDGAATLDADAPVEATVVEPTTVYLAGPLFCQAEREYNLRLAGLLEDFGYSVFLPQRDGYKDFELAGKSDDELSQMLFDMDLDAILRTDVFFFILDGRVPDEGACVELGIAYAKGKRCYGFKTDTRAAEQGLELNPMIFGCLTHLFSNYDADALIGELCDYLRANVL